LTRSDGMPLYARFWARVAADPAAVAVIAGDRTVTYAELDAWAGAVAAALAGQGVAAGGLVGICVPRSAAYVAALMGVLRAGAACVLLNPQDPPGRMRMVVEDTGLAALVTGGPDTVSPEVARLVRATIIVGAQPVAATATAWPDTAASPDATFSPDAPALVVATSGSTGRPKNVVLTHRVCGAGIAWAERTFALTATDRHLFKTSVSFVSVLRHLMWPLLTGGATVVVPAGEEANLPLLAALIREHGVTVTTFIPSSLRLFLDTRDAVACHTLRHLVCGGEVLTPQLRALAGRVLPSATVHNLYALSEAPLVTHWRCHRDDEGVSPMGTPVDDVRLLVLDDDGEPAPTGVTGELYVGGPGVATGYLGGDPADNDRFVVDQWPGATAGRLYRTGDRVVLDPGPVPVLRYVGRHDQLVKVHGYRIELGEIEAAATRAPGVTHAVVLAEPVRGGDHDITLFVAAPEPALDAGAFRGRLRTSLRESLPAYMIPPVVHVLSELPMLPNGKIDRAGLAAHAGGERESPPPQAEHTQPLQRRVAAEWRAVLTLATGAADENFFDAGGDSLAAMRLANRLQLVVDEALGVETDLDTGRDTDFDTESDADTSLISIHTVIRHPVFHELVGAVQAACGPPSDNRRDAPDPRWEEGTL